MQDNQKNELENYLKIEAQRLKSISIGKILCKRYCHFNENFFDYLVELNNFRKTILFVELTEQYISRIDSSKNFEKNQSIRVLKNYPPQVLIFEDLSNENETCARTRGDGWRFCKTKSMKQSFPENFCLQPFYIQKKKEKIFQSLSNISISNWKTETNLILYEKFSEQFLLDQIHFRLSNFFAKNLYHSLDLQEYKSKELLKINIKIIDILKFNQFLQEKYFQINNNNNNNNSLDFEKFCVFLFHFCGSILWKIKSSQDSEIIESYNYFFTKFLCNLVYFHKEYSIDNLNRFYQKFPHLSIVISSYLVCSNFKFIAQDNENKISLHFYLIQERLFESEKGIFKTFFLYLEPQQLFQMKSRIENIKKKNKSGININLKFFLFYKEKQIHKLFFDIEGERNDCLKEFNFPQFVIIRDINKICVEYSFMN